MISSHNFPNCWKEPNLRFRQGIARECPNLNGLACFIRREVVLGGFQVPWRSCQAHRPMDYGDRVQCLPDRSDQSQHYGQAFV